MTFSDIVFIVAASIVHVKILQEAAVTLAAIKIMISCISYCSFLRRAPCRLLTAVHFDFCRWACVFSGRLQYIVIL